MRARADWAGLDARTEGVVRGSMAYRLATLALSRLRRDWATSTFRRAVPTDFPERIRFWSWAAVVAAATALVLGPLGTTPRPLGWIVPALAGFIALVILAVAPRSNGHERPTR